MLFKMIGKQKHKLKGERQMMQTDKWETRRLGLGICRWQSTEENCILRPWCQCVSEDEAEAKSGTSQVHADTCNYSLYQLSSVLELASIQSTYVDFFVPIKKNKLLIKCYSAHQGEYPHSVTFIFPFYDRAVLQGHSLLVAPFHSWLKTDTGDGEKQINIKSKLDLETGKPLLPICRFVSYVKKRRPTLRKSEPDKYVLFRQHGKPSWTDPPKGYCVLLTGTQAEATGSCLALSRGRANESSGRQNNPKGSGIIALQSTNKFGI